MNEGEKYTPCARASGGEADTTPIIRLYGDGKGRNPTTVFLKGHRKVRWLKEENWKDGVMRKPTGMGVWPCHAMQVSPPAG